MRRVLTRTVLAVVTVLLVSLAPVSAAFPAITMIYGESNQKPIFVTFTNVPDEEMYAFLTCARSNSAKVGTLGTRKFLKIATYWNMNVWKHYLDDPTLLSQLKPEAANQHGRLYLPTSTDAAIVVSADYSVRPTPIPSELKDFVTSCTLSATDVAAALRLGIPGF